MANDDSLMGQDEIERLFSQTKDSSMAAKASAAAPVGAAGKDDQDQSGENPSQPGHGMVRCLCVLPIGTGRNYPGNSGAGLRDCKDNRPEAVQYNLRLS